MAKPTRFIPKRTPHGWRLNIPPKFSESGRRERHFYRTQKLALAAAETMKEKVEAFGTQARAISPALSEQAVAAAALLEPWGMSILDAARMAVETRERETASKTLSDAGAEWLLACEGLRDRTRRNYRLTLERLEKTLGGKLLARISAEEIQNAIAPPGTTGAAAAERIRNAKAFWFWSAKKRWCVTETFAGVELPKTSKDVGEIEILSPSEAEALLRTAEKHFPQAVASFAMQLFAGIRVEEITRMEAHHVTSEGIDLPASVTKKGRRRHITPNATLAAWLAKHPFVPCANWIETSAAVRRLAGWSVVSRILNDRVKSGTMESLPEAKRGKWPQNVLRHSHASYAVAAGTPLESLLFEFGHTGNAGVLRGHYVGRASKKSALEFYSITPEGAEAPANIQLVEGAA